MTKKNPNKKRLIRPPIRHWPPASEPLDDVQEDGDKDTSSRLSSEERGLAGADDIVQWLALLMNEKSVTYDQLAAASGVPSRTIKKWFDINEKTRRSPTLKNIQACLEALGQSLIATGLTITLNKTEHYYPIYRFRRELLEKWVEQSAKLQKLTPDQFIEKLESDYKIAVERGLRGPKRRVL